MRGSGSDPPATSRSSPLGRLGNDYIAAAPAAEDERAEGGPGDDCVVTTGGTDRIILGGPGNTGKATGAARP